MRKFYFLVLTVVFSAIANAIVTCIKAIDLVFSYMPTPIYYNYIQNGVFPALNEFCSVQVQSFKYENFFTNSFIKRLSVNFNDVWEINGIENNLTRTGYPFSQNISKA